MNDPCGILFLDKPEGWTSRKAVNVAAAAFSTPGKKRIKAGHAGTLDPLATGMLPILIGDATRFAEMGLNAEKCYRVTFDLSYQTDTLDREGEVCGRFEGATELSELETALDRFRGEIDQTPPAYSAIRINGKRAHELVRKGEQVEMQSRRVTILELQLIEFADPLVTLEVRCSKGTYIRSLARDIGEALGRGGCVTMLRRLSTGGWPAAMMVSVEQLDADANGCLLPLSQWLRDMQTVQLSTDDARRFLQGQRIQLRDTNSDDEPCEAAVFEGETLLGSGTLESGMRHMVLHPARILPSVQRRYL